MAWPKEIPQGGKGSNRRFSDGYDPRYGVDNKRKFLQDVTLVLLQKDNRELSPEVLQEIVDKAEHLNMLIVEKLR